MTLLRRQSL